MADSSPLSPLKTTIIALLQWFHAERVRGMIIGGVAASLLGRPRMTRDVDAMVWLQDPARWKSFLESAKTHGIEARISDALGFALQARVLLLRHMPTGIDIDVSFAGLAFEDEALARSIVGNFDDLAIPLPSPEDLIIMKAIAHRPRDAADIEAVLDAHPTIDTTRIRNVVHDFAELLDSPEIFIDLEKQLQRVTPRPPKPTQVATVPRQMKRASKKSNKK